MGGKERIETAGGCKQNAKKSREGNVKMQEEKERLLTIASFFPLIRERCIRRMMDRTKWIRDVSRVAWGGASVFFLRCVKSFIPYPVARFDETPRTI